MDSKDLKWGLNSKAEHHRANTNLHELYFSNSFFLNLPYLSAIYPELTWCRHRSQVILACV